MTNDYWIIGASPDQSSMKVISSIIKVFINTLQNLNCINFK